MAGPFDLTGRRALVTGGGGGIGRGLARALADAGASVAVLGRSESADEAAAELGGIAVRADLTDRDELRRGFAEAVERLGGLDILVNSHGIGRASDAVDHDLADWDEVIEVNLTATFELCQLAGRIMVAQGSGKIVNVASVLSFQGGFRVSVVRGEQGRRLAADDGARERVGAARRQRERDRAGLRQDGPQRTHLARRPGADGADQRPHPRRPLGRARRHRRRRRLPLLGRLGLRAGRDAAGRRRLALAASGLARSTASRPISRTRESRPCSTTSSSAAASAAITVAAAYHEGRDVFPHNPVRKVRFLEGGAVFFPPGPALRATRACSRR